MLSNISQAIIEDVRMQIDSNKKLSESERSRLEQQMGNLLQLSTQNINNKQVTNLLKLLHFST